jgi:hypothetical protein
MACGALVAFASPFALLLGGLMAPVLLVALTDSAAGKPVTRAAVLAGLAASATPAWHLWRAGGGMPAALDFVADPPTLALAWLACATAWALAQLLPVVILWAWNSREAARVAALYAELVEIKAEWDPP